MNPASSPAPSPGSHGRTDQRPPSRRVLKSSILWCSRWLVSDDGEFYRGKIHVEITASKEGETVGVKPVRGIDGLTDPTADLRVTPAPGSGQAVVQTGVAVASPSEMLRVMFSRDEVRILKELAGHEPSKAAAVMDRCRIEKSKFWVLWSNLQQRGVVGDADQGEGFVILVAWVREWVEERKLGERAA